MTKDAQQMALNFIETLENLQKTMESLSSQDINEIGAEVFRRFEHEDPEIIDTARIIILLAGGCDVCFACGSPAHNGCICGAFDKEIMSPRLDK